MTNTVLSGYEGSSYLHALPDIDLFLQPDALDDSPSAVYPIHFSTPGDYRVWSRAYADNADADAMYVGLDGQVSDLTVSDLTVTNLTGFLSFRRSSSECSMNALVILSQLCNCAESSLCRANLGR
jgi:hypothetical protein